METDAKGQLGGLETSKKEREKMAGFSPNWKCGLCGKSNAEILAETAEEARLKGEEEKPVEVPAELKMAFKDELEKEKDKGSDTEAELAEGFVRTTNVGSDGTADTSSSTTTYPAARPGQTVPQPTGTLSHRHPNPTPTTNPPQVTAPATIPPARLQQAQLAHDSREGVPVWIDRAIAAVVLCLVVMVMKVVLGM